MSLKLGGLEVGELSCKWAVAVYTKGDVTRDDSQRRFLAQHSVATLLRHCFEWLQLCSSIAALCCAKNRRCESSLAAKPWLTTLWEKKWNQKHFCVVLNMQDLYKGYKTQLKVSSQTNLQIEFHVIPQRTGQFSDRTCPKASVILACSQTLYFLLKVRRARVILKKQKPWGIRK